MKKILLLLLLSVFAFNTSLSLEPMKVGFVYNGTGTVNVRVQLANNVNNALFVGETFTGVTPNGSGVIIINVQDYIGSANAWTNYTAANVNSKTTLDIYVNGTLYAQYRLDALILNQAQTTIFDQAGNFNPPTTNSSLGTDGNRWKELFVDGSTVHIGPALGMGAGDELAFSYDDATNTATMTVAGEDVYDATDNVVTFNKLVSQNIGNNNTAYGTNAFNATATGASNTANGYQALQSNTTGSNNIANGYKALQSNTTGSNNTANGYQALYSNTLGFSNTANGQGALYSNTEGSDNTANGQGALYSNTTGSYNTANGLSALESNMSGEYNTANGLNALQKNTIGSFNTANGVNALRNNTEGIKNTANGKDALLLNTTGNDNTANGQGALLSNTEGISNTATGKDALFSNITGSSNAAFGSGALNKSLGFYNASFGTNSLLNSTGGGNTALGQAAGASITSGGNNVFIGIDAGYSGAQKVDPTNSIAIGSQTYTTADNQVVIGNGNITETQLAGSVIPRADNAQNLGSATNQWKDVYAKGNIILDGIGVSVTSSSISFGKTIDAHQTNETAYGVSAAQGNTGASVTATGYEAAYGNTGHNVTASGNSSAYQNTGHNVTASGRESAYQNSGHSVTASGRESAYQNSGNNVTASGRESAYQNTGSNVLALGNEAGWDGSNGNQVSNVTILPQSVLTAYANKTTADTAFGAMTLVSGNYYLYYNQALGTVGAYLVP